MNKIKTILVLSLLLCSINLWTQNSYEVVCEIDRNGELVSGSLQELLKAVEKGNPIRVGWELSFKLPNKKEPNKIQHWTDAGFITIVNGQVFAQISSIYQQGPSFENTPSIFLVDGKPDGWVAVIGTTGILRQKFKGTEEVEASFRKSGMTEEQINKQLKSMEVMKVSTKWAMLK